MGMDDANSHATVWLFGRTTSVQNGGFTQSDNHFMRLNRSKCPGTITCPQPSPPDTVPAGVKRLSPRPMKRPSAETDEIILEPDPGRQERSGRIEPREFLCRKVNGGRAVAVQTDALHTQRVILVSAE